MHKITVLYVDDEKANLLLFKVNFRNSFNLITATSGQEALEVLKENPEISVVISDLRMPGMSGLELVEKAHKEFPHIQYFLFSGIEISEEVTSYIDKKILSGYFKKPLSIDYILNKLSNRAGLESA